MFTYKFIRALPDNSLLYRFEGPGLPFYKEIAVRGERDCQVVVDMLETVLKKGSEVHTKL
jgi:hypothetical protein